MLDLIVFRLGLAWILLWVLVDEERQTRWACGGLAMDFTG